MNFPNPWITILTFVAIFFSGFFSFVFSKKTLDFYLKNVETKFLKSLEPIIGTIGFVLSFGLSLVILYYFILLVS
ncbi:MAG: hypothetical protein CL496_04250 [Actinobacteria bacterium]|jgi:hypothetical protein|nr:hypothetical protein [Actinomycetota bacterium]|tara:strand:- start:321 stop:545 length:225 start_codon:yes stop_codon:yes gene_type:complete